MRIENGFVKLHAKQHSLASKFLIYIDFWIIFSKNAFVTIKT